LIISADGRGRASVRFVLSHPANFIAFGFGVGLAPVAPGTFGTLLAFPIYALAAPRLDPQQFTLLLLAMFLAGIWACELCGRKLGVHDHGGMVWDETTAFLLVLFLTPNQPLWQAFAFLLFRLFDIFKPAPIRHFDRSIRNGAGVMLDDLLAAFYTLLCLAAWKFTFG
jgi:phosphatidylglycerophosphatase A